MKSKRGKQGSKKPGNFQNAASSWNHGKPQHYTPTYQTHNLAVQQSLMEIFDEFSDFISGELKSMRLEEMGPKPAN